MQTKPSQQALIQALQHAIRRQEGFRPEQSDVVFSSGCSGIDRLLPERGLRGGMILEWLALGPGSHAGLIGMLCCGAAIKTNGSEITTNQSNGMLVVIDRERNFYPPTAVGWGIDPRQMLVIHPSSSAEHIWAVIQSLESPAVAAVWTTIEKIDSKTYQRIRLATQTGNTLAVIIRPNTARGRPTWADAQFWVQPVSSSEAAPETKCNTTQSGANDRKKDSCCVEISLARCRGQRAGGKATLEIDFNDGRLRETTRSDAATSLRLVDELAHSKDSAGRTRA